jgi:hypothetical protein
MKTEIKLGFTGTRYGMTSSQLDSCTGIVQHLGISNDTNITEIHHGDCIGADAEFDLLIAEGCGFFPEQITRYIHQPIRTEHVANCANRNKEFYKDTVLETPLGHLMRNRKIVHACNVLIATPQQETDPGYGGTWYTYNFARKHNKLTYLVQPSGNVITIGEMPCAPKEDNELLGS